MAARIFIHVQHLIGIGHLMRMAVIAKELAATGAQVMLVSGGRAHPGLDMGAATFVQLPALRAKEANYNDLVDDADRLIDDTFRAHRRDLLLACFQGFEPHVVITEHFPFGRGKLRFELEPLLTEITKKRPKPLLLASVRDIIEPPESVAKEDRFLATANEHFDTILVHGDPSFAPFDLSFPEARQLTPPVKYTGYVQTKEAKAKHARSGILVSVGNGRTGASLINTAVQAQALDDLSQAWDLRLGQGFPDERSVMAAAEQRSGLEVSHTKPNLAADLATAALSVSMAGYNTVVDLAATHTPSVLVPYEGYGAQEQILRAEKIASRGNAVLVREASLSPEGLLQAMRTGLNLEAHTSPLFQMDGAKQTANLVQDSIAASGLVL